MLQLKVEGIAKSELVNESLPWLLEVLLGDLASTIGEGGVLAGLANAYPNLLVCMIPSSISEPELISAETLFSNRAKVTFFSSLGSVSVNWAEWGTALSPNLVSFTSVMPSNF